MLLRAASDIQYKCSSMSMTMYGKNHRHTHTHQSTRLQTIIYNVIFNLFIDPLLVLL